MFGSSLTDKIFKKFVLVVRGAGTIVGCECRVFREVEHELWCHCSHDYGEHMYVSSTSTPQEALVFLEYVLVSLSDIELDGMLNIESSMDEGRLWEGKRTIEAFRTYRRRRSSVVHG
jgi:hypothetical protein